MAIGRSVPVSGSAKSLWTENGDDLFYESGRVLIGSSTFTNNAAFEISSTSSAFLPPRMTTAQRNALGASAGMIIYNTSTSAVNVYTTEWVALGSGGGISSVSGTANEIEATTSTGAVTVGLPNDVTIAGTLTTAFFQTNGTVNIQQYGATTAAEQQRSYTTRRHIKISTTASGWQDIVSFRPKVTGTGADPGASTLWAVASGYIVVNLHANGVGNGHRRMEFAIFFDGSNAASADGYNNQTSGTAVDFRINRVGWVSTFQIQRTGSMTGLQGGAFIELNFVKGAGGNGDNIYWEVT
tara:strand:+ start:755 stop:1645 length:891 start_codon:yes stop_codon:yes gene_type:complete